MAQKDSSGGLVPRDRWEAQIAALDEEPIALRPRREPLTVGRIVHAALQIVEAEGFDALTMRRTALALGASPGALYAHVRDKSELDDLIIGELCSRVVVPIPDPTKWDEQTLNVCAQLRDQYLQYPGISRAALAATPHSLETLRINEGLLAILVAAGASPQTAAWATDAAFLYISAYSIVTLRRAPTTDADGTVIDTAEVIERFKMLPAARFPITVAHADEITSGDGHDRFEFTLRQLFRDITLPSEKSAHP